MKNKINEKQYWKSLDEKAGNPAFVEDATREFPIDAAELNPAIGRRNFLKFLGGSAALAGAAGCDMIRRPVQNILPYGKLPEHIIPGKPIYYATTMNLGDDVIGLLVENHEGRPTKIEGNPAHSASRGAAGSYQQASVMNLYNPDRLKKVKQNEKVSNLKTLTSEVLEKFHSTKGEGAALLIESQSSPSFYRSIKMIQKNYPKLMVYKYDPLNRDNLIHGLHNITGSWISPVYDYENADIVISFGSDFLVAEPGNVLASKQYSARRVPEHKMGMNRSYIFEHTFSPTAGLADHRIRIKNKEMSAAVCIIAQSLIEKGVLSRSGIASGITDLIKKGAQIRPTGFRKEVLNAIIDDLSKNRRKSLLVAGQSQPEHIHSLIYLINNGLSNTGTTVNYLPLNNYKHELVTIKNLDSLSALNTAMKNQTIKTLFILGGDPVYNSPFELKFGENLGKVEKTVFLTASNNTTGKLCQWIIPRSHYLESWGDGQSLDGSISIVQPLIRPMYDSLSDLNFLALLAGESSLDYDVVKKTLGNPTEKIWDKWLHDGIVKGPSTAFLKTNVKDFGMSKSFKNYLSLNTEGIEIVIVQDLSIYDGRFIDNPWLQEMPDPITKLTWDNAALLSPKTARGLGLKIESGMVKEGSSGMQHRDVKNVIRLEVNDNTLELPALVLPGHAEDSITIAVGYGQKTTGKIGEGSGFDVNKLRTVEQSFQLYGAKVYKTKDTYRLASTQEHWSLNGRETYQEATVDEYIKNPNFAEDSEDVPHQHSLWKEKEYTAKNQWGMSIDLSRCSGCNACLIGCQSENNLPIVGKEEVLRGREMHWIRMDRYFSGSEEEPDMSQQPITCLQCEMAPCEQVCPVAATTHSEEGLNDMAYNRCIGTRYCANNCPVKVRRFNFFDYHQRNVTAIKRESTHIFELFKQPAESNQMQFNPDVTVRMRGVMEKCTYCVQRINEARITAKNDNREIADGEIKSACQQTCPTDAIVFGNIADPNSKVSKLKEINRDFTILDSLNLKARTRYLASIKNPHPALVGIKPEGAHAS